MLLTCRSDHFATEHSIELTGLSKDDSWQLFCEHAGEISENEKKDLLRENPDEEFFTRHENKEDEYEERFLGEHDLMKRLNFNPQAILFAAKVRKNRGLPMRLVDLYRTLVSLDDPTVIASFDNKRFVG